MRRHGWVLLGWLGWVAVCGPAGVGQSTPVVRRGTPLYFDHDEESIAVTTRYQLCEDDVIDEVHCKDVDVIRVQGTLTFEFLLPAWVSRGEHSYAVRAFGEGEYSDRSNVLMLQVTAKPLRPQHYRQTTLSPAATLTTPTMPATLSRTTLRVIP